MPATIRKWIEERMRLSKNICSDAQIVSAEELITVLTESK